MKKGFDAIGMTKRNDPFLFLDRVDKAADQ